MRRSILLLGFLLAWFALPTVAQQQENKLEPPELDSYRRWGFLRARPGFELSNLGYDSNILSTSSSQVVSDYTATLSPKLDGLILLGSRAFVTLSEQFDYTVYLDNSDQNFWNNQFSTRATVPFHRFGVFGEVELDNLRLRPIDQQDIRPQSKRRVAGAGVIFQPGWRTEIELGRYEERWRYEDTPARAVAEVLDRDESLTDFELSYRLRGRTIALLSMENRQIEFSELLDTTDRDVTGWLSMAGFKLGHGGSLVGEFLVGWTSIDAQDPSLEDLSAMVGRLDATWIAGGRTRVRLRAERASGFAVSDVNAYYLNTYGQIRTVHYFNPFFGGEVSYLRGRLDFPEAVMGATRRDDMRLVELGARMRMFSAADGRRIEYSLTVGRYRSESTRPGFDQEKNTFGFGAVLGF